METVSLKELVKIKSSEGCFHEEKKRLIQRGLLEEQWFTYKVKHLFSHKLNEDCL